ncbi:MAG: hypothetical protein KUL83_12570 [Lentimicrobium sp.]|jgi:hypothetical protein|nr:hypothetical protein [Lentimicrobium sp.]MDY0026441.1 hypothetical protein [Lentimicrobium sp.]
MKAPEIKETRYCRKEFSFSYYLQKIVLYFSILLLITTGNFCSNEKTEKLNNLIPLVSQQSATIQDGCYHDIFIIHDSLLVLISECDTIYFSVYNKNTLKLITRFGKKGKGPYDFNYPFPFKTNNLDQDNKIFFDFYNLNLPTFTSINFEGIIKMGNFKGNIKSQITDKELFGPSEFNQLSNDNIAGLDNDNPNGLFFIYNKSTKNMTWITYTPLFKDVESRYLNSLYYGTLCSNGQTLVFAYRYLDIISFYDLDGKLLKQYSYSQIAKPTLSTSFSGVEDTNRIFYISSFGTKKYYLVHRAGQPWNILRDSKLFPSEILSFDWNGNLKAAYSLDYTPACFCYDEKENSIFCIERNYPIDGTVNIKKYAL